MGSKTTLTAEQREIKDRFREDVGYWEPGFDDLLRIDPEFFDAYREWFAYPHTEGALEPKVREFVLIAAYSQTTHLGEDGISRHVGRALDAGATVEEVFEVLQIASVLGVHSYMIGAKLLDERLGLFESMDDAAFEAFLDEFEEKRGYRPDWWGPYVAPDPAFLRVYLEYSSHPWLTGSLDPKTREFLYIAIDSTPAHLLEEGIDAHMANAIELGATADELAEVLQLTSLLTFDTMIAGAPALVEEARKRDLLPEE
ncbi:carboxymuconolactone decarboxylase family protein [Natrarchaeobius sp. A-rgal3]|uniref:carboxymuconolactone decarboxylase family protein n=1 Tax=Natrarchaeobius versutus TaxID=1679078 RepID=UPI00350FAA63